MASDHLHQDSNELGIDDLAALAMAGGAFDDLAAESDIYSLADGAEVAAS